MSDAVTDPSTLPIDLEAARRQTLGGKFTSIGNEQNALEELRQRTVTLPPHATYTFGDDIDWDVDPFQETNWCAQWYMLRWADPLRRSAEAGNPHDLLLWLEIVLSWIRFDTQEEGSSIFRWKDMTDAFRARTLIAGLPVVAERAPEHLPELIEALNKHGAWLADPQNHGHANHLMHQFQGLFACGRVLRNDVWTQQAVDGLQTLFDDEHDTDGINREGAIAYHLFNHKWWLEILDALEIEGFSVARFRETLRIGVEELVHATTPLGELVRIGDTGPTKPIGIDDDRLRYVLSAGADGRMPASRVKAYNASGYLYARSGWGEFERNFEDETFLAVPYGRSDKVHGHKDAGSLVYFSRGINWLADPGKFGYGKEPVVKRYLSRETHNLVTIRGRKFDASVRVELKDFEQDADRLTFVLVDLSYEGVRIERRVVLSFNTDALIIVDTIMADKQVTAKQRWLTDIGVTAKQLKRGFELNSEGKTAALIFSGKAPTVRMYLGDNDYGLGWVASGWKQQKPATQIELEKSGKRFRFITTICPAVGSSDDAIRTVPSADSSLIGMNIDNGRVSEQIFIAGSGVYSSSDEVVQAARGRIEHGKSSTLELKNSAARADLLDSLSKIRQALRTSPQAGSDIAKEEAEKLPAQSLFSPIDLGARAVLADIKPGSTGHSDSTVQRDRESYFTETLGGDDGYEIVGHQLEEFPRDGVYTFDAHNLCIAAALIRRPGPILTVLFQGAIDRAKVTPPIFQRLSSTVDISDGPVVSFYDATLDQNRELRLGWYLGNELVDLHAEIALIVSKMADDLGCASVLCVGSSGGGFAAMHVAALASGSAVAFNPQTDLRKYHAPSAAVAMETVFGRPQLVHEIKTEELERISVMERFRTVGTPPVTVVANPEDTHHWTRHVRGLADFVDEQGTAEKLQIVEVPLGKGHISVPRDTYEKTLFEVYKQLRDSAQKQ
ncbi:heparinase II/III domain-containing protein [Brevibacterium sp. UCMA 11754]|uniref:heparinase II/III domain-containing protein n=1 Tax=Brevibacterium sp. UCMA 11754 TaxID=2749198 RepID=UPI001F3E5FDE|nr:heparinase II/III family protein [Brevibacterium sp. UCMA 11754]MCF2570857.1 heparinase II/III family protein [Brevibacterium sp. UCMA 11754]